jgi:hypothetical protein
LKLSIIAAVCGLFFLMCGGFTQEAMADAKPVSYDLTLVLRAPTWSSQTGYISNYKATEFGGILKLNNVIGCLPHLHPFVSGMHALGDWNTIADAKNELQAGFDYDLGRGFTFSTWWDRHYTKDLDRAFVAVKYATHGLF